MLLGVNMLARTRSMHVQRRQGGSSGMRSLMSWCAWFGRGGRTGGEARRCFDGRMRERWVRFVRERDPCDELMAIWRHLRAGGRAGCAGQHRRAGESGGGGGGRRTTGAGGDRAPRLVPVRGAGRSEAAVRPGASRVSRRARPGALLRPRQPRHAPRADRHGGRAAPDHAGH